MTAKARTSEEVQAEIRHNTAGLCELWERAYSDGDSVGLMNAIDWCLIFEQPMPSWAKEAFHLAVGRVASFKLASWDAAFGKPHKGAKLLRRRKKVELRLPVWSRVLVLRSIKRRHRESFDVFEKVADEFHLGV